MNKTFKKYIGLAILPLVALSCSDDDNTGYSNLEPTNPTVTVTIPNPTISLTEKDSTFEFTVTLSEPQIVDVVVYMNVVSGTATLGEDFTIDNAGGRVLIPAYRTSAKGSITVKGDIVVDEDVETVKIQFGDGRTANATITPVTVDFNITNVVENDLEMGMAWSATFVDPTSGEAVAPTDIADMVLLLTDVNGNVVDGADGAGFEEYILSEDAPDGTYYVKAGIFGTLDPGPFDLPIADLSFTFHQIGKINEKTFEFKSALDLNKTCEDNVFTMVKIVKAGGAYEVTEVGEGPGPDVCD